MRPLLFFVFLLSSFLIIPNNANASHAAYGGSIHWECHNGKYVFFLKRYIACNSLTWSYTPLSLSITGNPLPRNDQNISFSTITLRPDSSKWLSYNSGVFDPLCSRGTLVIDCNASSNPPGFYGSYITYFYQSDTLELNGLPPSSGWVFSHVLFDATGGENFSSNNLALRAVMYKDSASVALNQCIDNSPKFPEVSENAFCKDRLAEYSEAVIDSDGDSIVYYLDQPLRQVSPGIYQTVSFKTGYSYTNPLPDTNQAAGNQPLNYDPRSGLVTFKANSWGSSPLPPSNAFFVKYTAETYREGVLLAKVSHERPLLIFDCPDLPNLVSNSAPTIRPPFSHVGGTIQNFSDTVIAGNSVIMNLSVLDTNTFNGQFQNIRIELSGQKLSSVYSNNALCPEPSDTLCASLIAAPSFYQNRQVYYYSALASWNSFISWQTDCDDLNSNGKARTHYFYIKASDDHCPVPAEVTKVVAITVLPDSVNCPNVSTSLDERLNAFSQLNLYPNPSNGLVFIEGLNESVDFQIFNIQGKLMKVGRLAANQNQLELPDADGMYFVSIRDESGNERTYKLIKQ